MKRDILTGMPFLFSILLIGLSTASLHARDGKTFDIELDYLSGESAAAGNALDLEGARSDHERRVSLEFSVYL